MAERVTSGGIPRPAAADELEEDEGEELDTDDDDDQPSLSASYLAPPLNDSGASSVGVAEMPNTKQYYGFELKEPSDKDRKIYER